MKSRAQIEFEENQKKLKKRKRVWDYKMMKIRKENSK